MDCSFYRLYAAAPDIEFNGRNLADSFLQTFRKFVQKDYLASNLHNFVEDAYASLNKVNYSLPMDPFEDVFLLIYQLSHRTLGCNEIADNPRLLVYTMNIVRNIDWTSGLQIMFTGLPTIPRLRKYFAGLRLYWIMNRYINERRRTGRRENDPVQVLMDQGYSNTLIACVRPSSRSILSQICRQQLACANMENQSSSSPASSPQSQIPATRQDGSFATLLKTVSGTTE